MRIAVFGGSFDPIHCGHTALAHSLAEKLQPDKVMIIPTYLPPHKQKLTMVTPEQRLAMCRLAFEGEPLFEISDIEIRRQGASYTYLTLQELSQQEPGAELYLLTGADMFMTIHQWKHPEIIFRLATICGVPRNDDNAEELYKQAAQLHQSGARTEILDVSIMTVSSTEIRRRIRTGEAVSGLVPEKVEQYIRQYHLYEEQDG